MTAIFFVTTKFTLLPRLEKYRRLILSMEIVLHCNVSNSVTDPGRFGTDPDPRIRTTDLQIRIRIRIRIRILLRIQISIPRASVL